MSLPIGDDVPPELLGYQRDPRWRDMSDYLVHFTDTAASLVSMLTEGFVRQSGPFGWAKNIAEVTDGHRSACLSEIPLDMIDRLISRHGHYGLGFKRDFVTECGGARVWYLDQGGPASQTLFDLVRSLLYAQDFANLLWKLTPFIDNVMPGRYAFEWEREWRVPGGLSFTLDDVAFVITPDGDRHLFEQNPSLDAPLIRPDDQEAWWFALPQELGDAVDAMVACFLGAFSDPVNHLPWDEGEYVWIVDQWMTEEAMEYLFGPLEPTVFERVADYLNGLCPYWVRIADMDSFGQ